MGEIKIPNEFGYIALTAAGGWFVVSYLAMHVLQARKKYNVQVNNLPPLLTPCFSDFLNQ